MNFKSQEDRKKSTSLIKEIIINYRDDLSGYQKLLSWIDKMNFKFSNLDSKYQAYIIIELFAEREEIFSQLKKRNAHNSEVIDVFCKYIGIEYFTLNNVVSKIPNELYDELKQLIDENKRLIEKIVNDDKKITKWVTSELNQTKKELQGLQGGVKARQIYHDNVEEESRFVNTCK